MFCVLHNVLKYFGIFSSFKNNLRFLFSKKTQRKRKKKNNTKTEHHHHINNINTLTSILTCDKQNILLQWHSTSASRHVGGDMLSSFSKQHSSCDYSQITQENVVISLTTVSIPLDLRAEVLLLAVLRKGNCVALKQCPASEKCRHATQRKLM